MDYFAYPAKKGGLALPALELSYNEILRMLTIRKGGLPNYEQLHEQCQELNKRLEFINRNGIHQEMASFRYKNYPEELINSHFSLKSANYLYWRDMQKHPTNKAFR